MDRHLCGAQQTPGFDPMLFQYWPPTHGLGPILKQHCVKSSCFLRELSAFLVCVFGWNRLHSALCTRMPACVYFPLEYAKCEAHVQKWASLSVCCLFVCLFVWVS